MINLRSVLRFTFAVAGVTSVALVTGCASQSPSVTVADDAPISDVGQFASFDEGQQLGASDGLGMLVFGDVAELNNVAASDRLFDTPVATVETD